MWEYSINVSNSNKNILNFLLSSLRKFTEKYGGLVAINEEKCYSSILIGVEEKDKDRLQNFLSKCIKNCICSFFKLEYLNKNLNIPSSEDVLGLAFKRAMINFDRETDYFIIEKNLEFDKEMYLDSFYNFKLKKLQSKWTELINLANDNREFLLDKYAFLDLLKFLIDNIDVSTEEIDIVENDVGYRIFTSEEDFILEIGSKEELISSVIDLSPQKMNIYCNSSNKAIDLLTFMYEKRVNLFLNRRNENDCLTFLKK